MKPLKPFRFRRHRRLSRRALIQIYRALRRHYGLRHWWPAETPFEVMVGAVLTQNTAWRNVEKAISQLKARCLLTPAALRKVPKKRLAGLIRPSGYFNVKADRLKCFMDFLWRRFNGRLSRLFREDKSRLRAELLKVKGIGEETADSILLYAARKRSFVVDAYTRRVLYRHGYIQGDEPYSKIQEIFETLLPARLSLYNDFHAQIVEVGKDFCRTDAQCTSCPLRRFL